MIETCKSIQFLSLEEHGKEVRNSVIYQLRLDLYRFFLSPRFSSMTEVRHADKPYRVVAYDGAVNEYILTDTQEKKTIRVSRWYLESEQAVDSIPLFPGDRFLLQPSQVDHEVIFVVEKEENGSVFVREEIDLDPKSVPTPFTFQLVIEMDSKDVQEHVHGLIQEANRIEEQQEEIPLEPI